MADSTQTQAAATGETKTLEQEAVSRLAGARTWKSYIELDLKEGYFFAAPNRQRQISSQTMPSQSRMQDAPELNTDQAFIICGDHTTEVVNAFLPEAEMWCERGPGMDLPGGKEGPAWKSVEDQVKKDDAIIFNAIKASNFYSEIPKAYYPDLSLGTVGLWIDRPHPASAVVCSAIPIRELEIDLGPYGGIDYRAAVRFTRNHYVRELLGEEIWDKLDAEQKNLATEKPSDRTQIVWAFWRKWEDKSDEVWQAVVMLGNKVVHDNEIKGEGSCPLIVTRFNPTADWPHGIGWLIQGLPTLRQIDELESMRIENAALSIKPPITYPDDSFAQVAQGFEEGMAYPVRQGGAADVKPIYTPPPPEIANFQYEEKIKHLRKLAFVDHPEQSGDTPPTATQWMDELARAQRRIGTPGMPFWQEGPAQYFLRFKFLLEKSGSIQPLQVDGRAISTLPRNPAQGAAEQQEIVKTMQVATYFAQTFPEEFKVKVDGGATMDAIKKKARAGLLIFRKPEDVQKAIEQMSKLVGDRPVPGPTNQVPGPAS